MNLDVPMCGFDSETTGVDVYDVENTKIVSFAMILQESENSEPKIREWLMNPGIEIPAGASDVHGITTEYAVEHGRDYVTCLQEIADAFTYTIINGIVLTAYNGSFDITLIRNQFEHHGIRFDPELWGKFYMVDPLVMDKSLNRFRKGKRTLSVVASLNGYSLEDAHEATADVLATIHVARKILPAYVAKIEQSGLEVTDFGTVMAVQCLDYKNSSLSLEQYFRKKENDPTIVINKSWPFQDREHHLG